jgi:chromate transport protein ChrA
MRRLSDHPAARYAIDAMSAAVVGLIAFAAAILARQALQPPSPWTCAALMLGSLLLLTLVRKANSNWIILAAALAGWLLLSPMRK